jgi:O-antigen/teichoic acid export membrane protein
MSRRDLAGPRLTFPLPARLAPFRWTIGATGGLVAASVITSATGFVFWWFAARQYPVADLGLAGAAVSAMLLLSQIAVLGFGTALAGVLHHERRAASLAVTAMTASGVAGVALGLAFGLLAPLLSADLEPIRATPLALAIFVIGVAVTAVVAVLDQVLIAVSRRLAQLTRNVVFGVGRLLLLAMAVVLLAPEGMAIYAAWLAGTVLSLIVILPLVLRSRPSGGVLPLMWSRLREMATDALTHHVVNLSRSASVWLLPVLVTITLSSEANAGFYVAFLMANLIVLVGKEATFTLYIVGARAPDTLWHQARFTFGLSAVATLIGTVAFTLLGRPLLALFGESYADSAYPTVAILALSALPVLVKDHWIAIHRVRGSVSTAAIVGVVTLVIELAAAAVGALWAGLIGFAVLRLVALVLEAAFMAPLLLRAMARPPSADPVAAAAAAGDADGPERC